MSRSSALATSTGPIVSVRGLSKSYDGNVVLNNFSMDICAGEVVGLIGANGAGKTTVVECLQGLRDPDAGSMSVLGLDPRQDAQLVRSLLGSQLQDSGLPDRMRVSEAISLFAGANSSDSAELLEQFGITHRSRTPFVGLSGGERQRLFLILALLNQPRLLILDELTQGLDPAARRNVWAAVDQLRNTGVTILLVTHELSEADALCDRVIAMRSGEILDSGTPAELISRHSGEAIIRFTLNSSQDEAIATALQELNRLPGVQSVTRSGRAVTLRGNRALIAHVGSWLVTRSEPIPADLEVRTPDLEAALLTLLSTGSPSPETVRTPEQRMGGAL